MAIQSSIYATDGTTRTYPSTKHIATKQHCSVWKLRVSDSVWEISNVSEYSLVNNSVIFVDAVLTSLYSQVEIRVADTSDELLDSPTDIAIVSSNIADIGIVADGITGVNTVATNIASVITTSASIANVNTVSGSIANVNIVGGSIVNVNAVALNAANINVVASDLLEPVSEIDTVATSITNVNTVGSAIANVNTVATNITNVNSVANTIVPNIAEILLADDNAIIATEQAAIATAMATVCTSTYDQFDDRYLGPKATPPLVDNDGNALVYGTLYFDTTQNFMKVWSNAGWINAGSSVNGTTERYTYHATAGQTVFAATYEAGYIDVFLNGSKLENGVDFTAVTATNITLTSPAALNDVVDIICYAVFELSTAPTKDVVAYTVSTVADLASVPSSYTTAIVKDLNRGGTFIWSSTGTANGGTVFAGATGFWNRQHSGSVNPLWFEDVALYSALIEQQAKLATTTYLNKFGREYDALIQNNTTGRLYNANINQTFFGVETLQHWFSLFNGANNQNSGNTKSGKIVCTGDSTTEGVGGTYGGVPYILSEIAKTRGYPNVAVLNRGRSGEPTTDWVETSKTTSWESTYLSMDLADDPDLLIIRWGANDPFYNVVPLGSSAGIAVNSDDVVLTRVIEAYRRCLSTIRTTSGFDVANLSILIVSPGMMNDVHFGRDEVYFTKLNSALKEIALDFKCAYIDTISMFNNSWGGAGIWMDSDATSGVARAIHPHDELYEHIARGIANVCLPDSGVNWKVNDIRNTSGTTINRLVTDLPNTYFSGINIDRFEPNSADKLGAKYNGASITIKQSDGVTMQTVIPIDTTNGQGISIRRGFNNVWDTYICGASYNISSIGFVNGWSNLGSGYEEGRFKKTLDGYTHLSGVLSVGTVVDGTIITTLPVSYRPLETIFSLAMTELGTCIISVLPTGEVKIYRFASGGAYISLNNVGFQAFH